ncbi:MAG TPA: RNA polymerase recycling motor ATPase HelR [Sporichthyaceae bacterium]|jgi:DNA helicase IV
MNRGDVDNLTSSAFELPEHLSAKADPTLIGDDERHFAAIGAALAESIADLSQRLADQLRAPGARGQAVMERDLEVHRLTSRLNALRRYGLDLCLGRMVPADGSAPVYIGRLGLTDPTGDRLLVDWRSPAAEPFFGATHATPMGLASRRRYRWTKGRISDYWDEVFTPDGLDGHAALDDQSAFIASLGSTRSDRMRDVLATIAADQDAIIRASAKGALIVDGGPGTGKTVVALHRAAYLLHADPRLQQQRRGGVLVVGPSRPYLTYVADVLPSLGEEGVRTCTLRDLVPEGATAPIEDDPAVARLKADLDPPAVLEAAVAMYEEPPTKAMAIDTQWAEVQLTVGDWAEAFGAAESGIAHNDAREVIWAELLRLLIEKHDAEVPANQVRRVLNEHSDLREAFNRAWPLLEPPDIVGDLWSVPAYLHKCAPHLAVDDVRRLQRPDAAAWTVSDLPLLDAARQRIGDPAMAQTKRRRTAQAAAAAEEMQRVVETIIEADHDGEAAVTMLRGEDLVAALADESVLSVLIVDALAGPFAHIVVDEAQELTDAEWQMLLSRCPSRSFTVVGDRAQARHGFTESWHERLKRVGFDHLNLATLSINYRTPAEIMAEAEPVIRAVLPDANVPTSIRSSGIPVRHGSVAELPSILDAWLADNIEGIACVIGDPRVQPTRRIRSLTPELAKGLEFDLVVLIDPELFGTGIEGAVDRYVALTRATRELVILRTPDPSD